MTKEQKQKIDDFFDSYTPEQLKEKWEKYDYLSKPKRKNFLCTLLLKVWRRVKKGNE
jgi:hypothetical protein